MLVAVTIVTCYYPTTATSYYQSSPSSLPVLYNITHSSHNTHIVYWAGWDVQVPVITKLYTI